MFKQPAAAVIVAATVLMGACDAPADDAQPERAVLSVVATTSILGDVVANIVGDDATVEVLIPRGADPHEFLPSANQVAAVARADLVVANGLGLEEGLDDILQTALDDGVATFEVAAAADPMPWRDGDGGLDPHVWLDPLRMATATEAIGEELTRMDPEVDWPARAAAYAAELRTTHDAIEEILAPLSAAERVLVTNHDSMSYFAERYGFAIVGIVVPGGSSLAAPSAGDLAALVEKLLELRPPAIFADASGSTALAESIAAEGGLDMEIVELYTGSLGEPGSDGATLEEMLLTNARRIAAALS